MSVSHPSRLLIALDAERLPFTMPKYLPLSSSMRCRSEASVLIRPYLSEYKGGARTTNLTNPRSPTHQK